MRKFYLTVAAAAMACMALAAPAQALQYSFDFEGVNLQAMGLLTTSDTPNAINGYDVISITGSVSGFLASGPINNLVTDPIQPNLFTFTGPSGNAWNIDNTFFIPGTSFDNNGVMFAFGGSNYGNLYSVGSDIFLSIDTPQGLYNPGDIGSFTTAAVPGPIVGAGLPGLITACAGLLALARRRRKQASDTPFAAA
jgi:hypothetical protein